MKISVYCKILLLTCFFQYALIPPMVHGTVVTDDMKHWAKNASQTNIDAQGPESLSHIGILYFDNQTSQQNMDILQKGVPLLLTHDLINIGSLKVVSREKVEALMQQTKTNTTDLNKTDTSDPSGKSAAGRVCHHRTDSETG